MRKIFWSKGRGRLGNERANGLISSNRGIEARSGSISGRDLRLGAFLCAHRPAMPAAGAAGLGTAHAGGRAESCPGGKGGPFAASRTRAILLRDGRCHFNEVTLDSSVARSGRAAGLRPANAIASIPIVKSEPLIAKTLARLRSR